MHRSLIWLGLGLAALAPPATAQAPAGGHTLVVEMKDFAFSPAQLVVTYGDTVRFLQTTATPHNVEFVEVPDGTRLGQPVAATAAGAWMTPPRMGPFLITKGQAYELVITDAFSEGTHEYVCTPHVSMGMRATLVVTRKIETE